MKKRILASIGLILLLGGCVSIMAFVSGCRTVTVENDKEKGWSVSVWSNMMKSEVDNIKANINPDGTISFDMGGLTSSPSEEFAKSLMTATYIARIAAAMYNPAAAAVPLSADAADAQSVASIISAQSAAKVAAIRAKSEAALVQSYLATLTAESAALVQEYIAQKKSGTITVTKLDGTTQTVVCADGYCNPQ